MQNIIEMLNVFRENVSRVLGMANITMTLVDLVEIIIISFLFYRVLIWIKSTRAWNLFKGIMVILFFVVVAAFFQMSTILWIAENTLNIGLIAVVIIFQPELRNALENIGGRNFFMNLFTISKTDDKKFSDKTVDELVKAVFAMSKVKTGALIVLEDEIALTEYIRTGIDVDALISSQLLINIFEKNTPLHDGAIIVRGDRVVSATCYLPLSDSLRLSKELGTRHRAAVGISEVSDSLTIIVSEETGKVSVASHGNIYRDLDADGLREKLKEMQSRGEEESHARLLKLKRRFKNEK